MEPKDVTYEFPVHLNLLIFTLFYTKLATIFLLHWPIYWSFNTLICYALLFCSPFFYDLSVKKRQPKYVLFGLAFELLSIATITGLIWGFFGGLSWGEFETHEVPTGNSTCIYKNALFFGIPYYLSAIFLYIISIILFIFMVKCTFKWVDEIEAAESMKNLDKSSENLELSEDSDLWRKHLKQFLEDGTLYRRLLISSLIQTSFGLIEYIAVVVLTFPLRISFLLLPMFVLPPYISRMAVEKIDKRFIYYSVLIQLFQIFTTSGIALSFYSGLEWRDYFDESETGITCSSSPHLAHIFYLVGVLLHVISTIAFICCYKFVYGWMRADRETCDVEEAEKSAMDNFESCGNNEIKEEMTWSQKLLQKFESYFSF